MKTHQSAPRDGPGPAILRPWNRKEAIDVGEAADVAGRHPRTIRNWCIEHSIGRQIAGRWAVSRPALMMFLSGDNEALRRYLVGDRSSDVVRSYFEREGLADLVTPSSRA